MSVLYLSADGVLKPLGFSQIVRPIVELSRRGLAHALVTLEWEDRLRDAAHLGQVEDHLRTEGIAWSYAPFRRGGGGRSTVANISSLVRLAAKAARANPIRVLHARAFHVTPAALVIERLYGLALLYDIRGYGADQRFSSTRALRVARIVEAESYSRAAAVVSLTEIGCAAVRRGQFGPWAAQKPVVCIPTCVDYESFRLERERVDPRLADRLVIAWVGSLNRDYLIRESLRLFRYVHALRPDAMLLCLTEHAAKLRSLFDEEGVPGNAVLFVRAHHDEMPRWLGQIDWGLLLLDRRPDKGGSMPTKLAEFLAAGVRPIHVGCNDEVRDWVVRTGSGISLPDASDTSLRRAAEEVARSSADAAILLRAREIARPHFSLSAGVDRYERLLRSMMGGR